MGRFGEAKNARSFCLSWISVCFLSATLILLAGSLPAQTVGSKSVDVGSNPDKGFEARAKNEQELPEYRSENLHLRLAEIYEELGLWKEAKAEYLKAANDPSAQSWALDGLRRVCSQPLTRSARFNQTWESVQTTIWRCIEIFVSFFLVYAVVRTTRVVIETSKGMEIGAFAVDGDDPLASQISVTFARIRSMISDAYCEGDEFLGRSAIDFVLPRLDQTLPYNQLLPEVSFEAAGLKISNLNSLASWLLRPRFRVTGGVLNAQYQSIVHAEIWEKEGWFRYKLRGARTHHIPSLRYHEGLVALEVFVYDVLLTVIYAPH